LAVEMKIPSSLKPGDFAGQQCLEAWNNALEYVALLPHSNITLQCMRIRPWVVMSHWEDQKCTSGEGWSISLADVQPR
jgi:hypothetical protein